MNSNPLHRRDGQAGRPASSQSENKESQAAGTPEETHLTVKLMAGDWIIENGVGVSIGSAKDRESAIKLAKEAAPSQKASAISVLTTDGSLEENIKI